MADHLGLIDELTTNPCCSAWKDRVLKLQHKIKKAEDGRAALKRAVEIYRQQFDKAQDESLKLKKAYEEEKLQTDHERKDKEKESAARVSLEKEISALKSEILSLRQKGGQIPEHVNEELVLLRGRVVDSEKEINRLREEKKKSDEACESSKTEKKRFDQELSSLKAQLLNVDKENKQLKKDLQKEKVRADSEKKRADEVIKTAKTEQKGGLIPEHVNEELILLRGRVFDREKEINCLREEKKKADEVCETSKTEKNRANQELSNLKAQLHNVEQEKKQLKKDFQKEKARADSEKKRADEVLKTAKTKQAEVEVLKDEKKNTSLIGHVSEMEAEIRRLKELLDKERILMDNERKKAETEKSKANKMQEMFKREQSTAAEQRRLVDVEKKKAEEFAHQLQRLKCEADEAKSKLVSEGSKLKEANKKLDAERKKTSKEKKKAQEQQKIAEMSTKHALEKERHADCLQQKLEENQKMYEKLKKDMEELKLRIQEEKQKTNNCADLAMEKETEQKKAADVYKLEAMKQKSRADKLALQLEDIEKRTKSASKEIHDLVSLRNLTEPMKIRSAEIDILKKRLKLEKARVKHANQVADLEKKCKKAVEEELCRLKLEFARFSNRVGLCSCFSTCNIGASCLEKNGNENLKRKITHSESGKELMKPTFAATKSCELFRPSLDSPSQSLPISGTCTESTAGTASKIEPLLGGSNRTNLDNFALLSSMASFSDRQLVGSQENCRFPNTKENSDIQLHISQLSSKAEDTVRSNKDVNTKKRKRNLNEIESIEPLSTEGYEKVTKKVSASHGISVHMDKELKEVCMQRSCKSIEHNEDVDLATYTCNNDLEIFKRMLDGDCMKLLSLDSEVEEERYRVAVERPLSPTLPIIDVESNQSDDCGPIEVNCSYGGLPNQYDDSSQFIVVFSEIKDDSSRLSKIVHMTRTCCTNCQSDYAVKTVVSALSTDKVLSPKEKVCVFFSFFLKQFSSIATTNFNHAFDAFFWNNIDIFSEEMRKVMSDVDTRTMFTETWNLDDLITLIQNFTIDGRLLVCTDVNSETQKASLHQFVIGAVLLASVCAAFELIDSICEVSYTISRITTSSTYTFLHVFAYVCGEKLLSQGDDLMIMTVIKSLVTYGEREYLSSGFPPCAKCPFSDDAVSMEEIASLLLKKLSDCCMQKFGMTTYKSSTFPDDTLSNLGDVLSLLELLASKMSWGWVCENIISSLLTLLEVCVMETPLTAIFALLGQMARLGIDANGLQDAKVENIRVKLSSFISQSTSSKISLAVQFAAVNALLTTTPYDFQEVCKNSVELPKTATDCIQKWFSLLSEEHKSLSVRLLTADDS